MMDGYNPCRQLGSWLQCSHNNHESEYDFTTVIDKVVNHCELLCTFINVQYGDIKTLCKQNF